MKVLQVIADEEAEQQIVAQSEEDELLIAGERFLALKAEKAAQSKIAGAETVHALALNMFTKEQFGLSSEELSPAKKKFASDILLGECKKIRRRFIAFAIMAMLAGNYVVLTNPGNTPLGKDLFYGSLLGAFLIFIFNILGKNIYFTQSPFGPFSAMAFIRVKNFLEEYELIKK